MTMSTLDPKVLVLVIGLWNSLSISTIGAKDQFNPKAEPSLQAT